MFFVLGSCNPIISVRARVAMEVTQLLGILHDKAASTICKCMVLIIVCFEPSPCPSRSPYMPLAVCPGSGQGLILNSSDVSVV